MLKKINSTGKKYWWIVAIATFIIGVGSLSASGNRAKEVLSNPTGAVAR